MFSAYYVNHARRFPIDALCDALWVKMKIRLPDVIYLFFFCRNCFGFG